MRLKYLGTLPFYTHTGGLPTKWTPYADVPDATGQMLLILKDNKGKPRFELAPETKQAQYDDPVTLPEAQEGIITAPTMEETKEEIKRPSSPVKRGPGRPRKG